ncbi:SCO1431 family membrane protein [Streptomyces sp. NPDC050600]|uniref:SCO1431 family membrane protein n=1 Tax=unclassified Streptomyces TaxID=2593676 RepID=UPI003441E505
MLPLLPRPPDPRAAQGPCGRRHLLSGPGGAGGPEEDGPEVLEHLLGWTLVVVLALVVTRVGLR